MHPDKIEMYEREIGPFPDYRTLSCEETERLCRRLAEAFGLRKYDDFRFPFDERTGLTPKPLCVIPDDNEPVDFRTMLRSVGVAVADRVFTKWWGWEEQLDEFELDDLQPHFNSIWYRVAEDVDLFDRSMSWVCAVHHDGDVWLIQPPTSVGPTA